jgi:glycosyltransferase involved in cell wall biosynthesis
MLKKILLIPSWYPSIRNSSVGSFFREQASLLTNTKNYDIKVLYGVIKEVSLLEFIVYFISEFLRKKVVLSQNYLIQNPEAHSFVIKIYKGLTDEQKYFILIRAYAYAYRVLSQNYAWQPDLIHAQSAIDGGIFAKNLSLCEIKKPYLIIEHQFFVLDTFSHYKRNLILDAIKSAKKVGVVSEHQKKMILMHEHRCNPVVIWNYTDETKFYIDESVIKLPIFTIITITNPFYIKDADTFFRAIQILATFCQDFKFIIIGNASYNDLSQANTNSFEEMAIKLGIHRFGTFIAHVERNELPNILNSADVLAVTSIAETFGIAAREAMMCGLPVVTTACGGVEDSINEQTGRIVPIRDAEKLAQTILAIKNKKITFDGKYIREYAISQCGGMNFIKEMNNFYCI